MGLLLTVVVHGAQLQDRDGGRLVLSRTAGRFKRLRKIWADGGYAGQLLNWTQEKHGWEIAIVKRSDRAVGFEVLPRRWVVERTFGWIGRYRRHSKDYEYLPASGEAMIRLSMINLMLHRLAPEDVK